MLFVICIYVPTLNKIYLLTDLFIDKILGSYVGTQALVSF